MADKIIDAKLFRDPGTKLYDIAFGANGDLVIEEGFNTRILMSQIGERRADESEVSQPSLRRGWIGNLHFEPGVENGSKIWLLSQERNTPEVLQKTINFSREGYTSFKTNGLADDVLVTGTQAERGFNLNAKFIVDNNVVANKNFNTWEKTLENA